METIEDLIEKKGSIKAYDFEQKLSRLIEDEHRNQKFENNKPLIMGVFMNLLNKTKKNEAITDYTVQKEFYKIRNQKHELGLDSTKLKRLKSLLGMFKNS